jgi:hypothetical protein
MPQIKYRISTDDGYSSSLQSLEGAQYQISRLHVGDKYTITAEMVPDVTIKVVWHDLDNRADMTATFHNHKIEAIKFVRNTFACGGLIEAKNMVENGGKYDICTITTVIN